MSIPRSPVRIDIDMTGKNPVIAITRIPGSRREYHVLRWSRVALIFDYCKRQNCTLRLIANDKFRTAVQRR